VAWSRDKTWRGVKSTPGLTEWTEMMERLVDELAGSHSGSRVKLIDNDSQACIGTLRDRRPYINLFVVHLQTRCH